MLTLADDEFSVGESYRYSERKNTLERYPKWTQATLTQRERIATFLRVPPPISNPLYRYKKLDEIGCFDDHVRVRQEVDLFFRYVLKGNKPTISRYPVFVYRNHATEGRVSALKLSEAYTSDIEILERAVSQASQVDGRDDFALAREALALRIWNMGRDMLRNHYLAEAKVLFALANKCSSKRYVEGKLAYRVLNAAAGPAASETILTVMKRIAGYQGR